MMLFTGQSQLQTLITHSLTGDRLWGHITRFYKILLPNASQDSL